MRLYYGLAGFFAILGLGLILYPLFFQSSGNLQCVTEEREHQVVGFDLLPKYKQGEKLLVLHNFYSCNPVDKGDFVLFQISANSAARVRRVVGVPGDRFEVVEDTKKKAWNLKINGKLIPWQNGQPYFFGSDKMPPTLRKNQDYAHGEIPRDNYIVLALVAPGSADSSFTGLVRKEQLIGKVDSF